MKDNQNDNAVKTECIDFVIYAANCSSDGCPEYFFDHCSTFEDERAREAYCRAMKTIEKHELWSFSNYYCSPQSLFNSDQEMLAFVGALRKKCPESELVTTIWTCSHGTIYYQKSARTKNIREQHTLVEAIREALPPGLIESKGRVIESYLFQPDARIRNKR